MSTTFIKIPNNIIGNLKGHRCTVYLYLLYLCTVQRSNCIKVKQETIRNHTGVKFNETVNIIMHYLQDNGYVKLKNNYNPITGRQICNTITVCNFDPQNNYFLLPSEYLFIDLPPIATELLLALYMFSFQDPLCFPSFKQISKAAKIGTTSIVNAYTILEEKGIIRKENYKRKDGSKGHNRYFLIKKIERIVGSEKTGKFLAWIRKQKEIYFELWQIIKEVLMGNIGILDEICTQFDCCEECKEYSDFEYADELEDLCTEHEHQSQETDNSVGAAPPTIFGILKKKVSRIRGRIRQFFVSVSRNFKRVLP